MPAIIPLSPEQTDAVAAIQAWYDSRPRKTHGRNRPYFQAGYAGTGKTSLIPHILRTLGIRDDEVILACPTNSAARVLQRKVDRFGIKATVRTVHQLVYVPSVKTTPVKHPDGSPVLDAAGQPRVKTSLSFERRDSDHHEVKKTRLVILDEISMVDDRACHDVLDLGIPTLFIGDIGQLEPVSKATHAKRKYAPFNRAKPDNTLQTIHRQGETSNITAFAHYLREGGSPTPGNHGDVTIIRSADFFNPTGYAADALRMASQVICGLNETRHELNRIIRALHGVTDPMPRAGDRIICMRSNRDMAVGNTPLFNGLVCRVEEVISHDATSALMLVSQFDDPDEVGMLEVALESFGKTVPTEMMGDDLAFFDFAYAITTHKSQGNEYDDVIVIDEGIRGVNTEKRRYTAVTRAAKRLLFVM